MCAYIFLAFSYLGEHNRHKGELKQVNNIYLHIRVCKPAINDHSHNYQVVHHRKDKDSNLLNKNTLEKYIAKAIKEATTWYGGGEVLVFKGFQQYVV